MSSTTVASVEAYTSNNSQLAPDNYAQFSQQPQVSVSLIDNNLWLVDKSQLNAQTIAEPPVALLNWTPQAQTTVSLDNTTAVASPASLAVEGTAVQSTLSPIDLSAQNVLQLSKVTGSLQFNSGTTPSSSGLSSFSSGGISSTDTSSSSFSGDGSSTAIGTPASSQSKSSTPNSSTGTNSTSTRFPPSSSTSTSSTPTGLPPSSSTSLSTSQTVPSTSTPSTTTSKSVPPSSPNSSPNTPVPVPFDVSPTLGLAIVLGIWAGKPLIRKYSPDRWFRQLHQHLN